MKRLYWTNPDVYEIEVEVKSVGDCKVDFEDFRLMANHWLVDSTAAKSL